MPWVQYRGLDLDLRYSHDAWGGRLSHRALVSYLDERDLVAFPGAAPLAGAGGFDADNIGAIPRWRGTYGLDWHGARWSAGYALQWIGALEESGGVVFPGSVNAVDDTFYHDFWTRLRIGDGATLAAGIDNLTNDQPPSSATPTRPIRTSPPTVSWAAAPGCG